MHLRPFTTRTDIRSNYLFNSRISGVEEADLLLLVGTNPRFEAPTLNARIRKCWIHNDLQVAMIGPRVDLTYDYEHLGDSVSVLHELVSGKHPFAKRLAGAEQPMIILGSECMQRPDNAAIHKNAMSLASQISGSKTKNPVFNVLHRFNLNITSYNNNHCETFSKQFTSAHSFRVLFSLQYASQVAALDLGYTPSVSGIRQAKPRVVFLVGADRGKVSREDLPKDCLVVFVGHHGDRGALMADVVLPGAAYTEKNAIYANTEGRAQHTQIAVFPPGLGREDWRIFRAISEVVGLPLPYDNLEQVRSRIASIAPGLLEFDVVQPAASESQEVANQLLKMSPNSEAMDKNQPINLSLLTLSDYYITDCISRASQTMAKCVKAVNDAEAKMY
ncbi:NDUS1 [Fasciola gigantica]|uniref:NDUS1 n=1 Tax=Fasciola gigantica TaxID=46835 RepID=A0A504YUE1_FASGI|nr:NDUS1 [Fasciola gigantica]